MSTEIVGEPPVVDHPVDGQPKLVNMKVTTGSGTVEVYPMYEPKIMKETKDQINSTRTQKLMRTLGLVVLTIFTVGTAFGVGIGYSIWG